MRLAAFAGEPAIWRLAVAQTLLYAGLYYIFPGLLSAWEAGLGRSRAELTLAFTAGMVAWALVAPWAGRQVDRGRGPLVLGAGPVAGGLALMALAAGPGPVGFVALWVVIGASMGISTYEPCFALVTSTRGVRARRSITMITLVAGFAGTLSFPFAHWVTAAAGWEAAVLAAGAVVILVAAPLAWTGARRLERTAEPRAVPAAGAMRDGARFLGRPAFWFLGFALSAAALAHSVVIGHLLPLLAERGIAAGTAVLAASSIGPMQVAGRLAMMAVEARVSNRAMTAAVFVAMTLAPLALLAAAGLPAALVPFVILQGAGIGVLSIMKPMVTRDIFGDRDFGLISGSLALPSTLASAAGPFAAALVWGAGGYGLVLDGVVALMLLGLLAFLLAARPAR